MERILRGGYIDPSALKKERYEKEIAFRKKSILTKQAEMIEHKSILLDYEYLLQQLEAEEQVEQDDLQTKARLN
jgi:hypothetical protein